MINPDNLYWFTSSMGRVEFKLPGQCVTANDISESVYSGGYQD